MAALVLDKCYLQAATWQTVCTLAEEHDLVMSGGLFHELLSGNPKGRAKVFSKLPRKDNPVHLVDNLTSLLRHEGQTHTPAGDILAHTLGLTFRFNDGLRSEDYALPPDAVEGVADNVAMTAALVESYVARTNELVDMFHRVTKGSDDARRNALAEIEEEIANPENVLAFYRTLSNPELPPADLLTSEWATLRFYQVGLLFSLHTIYRHRGPVPATLSPREFERLEHDIHDSVALILGTLSGALATDEKKLQRWFRLLRPDGLLIPSVQPRGTAAQAYHDKQD